MVTSYILILVFSAWLMSSGLTLVAGRILRMTHYSLPALPSLIALLTAVGFLTVVAAPGWLMVATLASLLLFSKLALPLPSGQLPWLIVLLALVPLLLAPLFGAPSWLAIDAALIAASLLGVRLTSRTRPELGAAFPSFLLLIVGLGLHAGVLHAS